MSFDHLFNVDKKLFIVTGAASGLGRETAVLLSSLGAKLILVDCNPLDDTVKSCQGGGGRTCL